MSHKVTDWTPVNIFQEISGRLELIFIIFLAVGYYFQCQQHQRVIAIQSDGVPSWGVSAQTLQTEVVILDEKQACCFTWITIFFEIMVQKTRGLLHLSHDGS